MAAGSRLNHCLMELTKQCQDVLEERSEPSHLGALLSLRAGSCSGKPEAGDGGARAGWKAA